MRKNYKTFIVRKYLELRQRMVKNRFNSAMNDLNGDGKVIFNKVIEIAKNNRDSIRFDELSGEILIILPNALVTLKSNRVSIDNTTGFLVHEMLEKPYGILVKTIQVEAHRERRKLKYEIRNRIRNFVENIEH